VAPPAAAEEGKELVCF